MGPLVFSVSYMRSLYSLLRESKGGNIAIVSSVKSKSTISRKLVIYTSFSTVLLSACPCCSWWCEGGPGALGGRGGILGRLEASGAILRPPGPLRDPETGRFHAISELVFAGLEARNIQD